MAFEKLMKYIHLAREERYSKKCNILPGEREVQLTKDELAMIHSKVQQDTRIHQKVKEKL
jgi:hypothetical protein